MSDKVVCIL